MRIIGLGLMALLLTGTALVLSGYNVVQTGIHRITDATRATALIFEPEPEGQGPSGGTEVAFLRDGATAPLILSGLPSYGSARFGLPVNARPVSGYLQIDTTLQTLKGVEGLLRVSIDNVRRGEVLLVPGLVTRSFQIPLTGAELAGEALDVSFSLVGTGSSDGCANSDHLAAVAEIEASSSLVLTLASPLKTMTDRIAAWGNDVHVGWSQELSPQDRADRLAMASALTRMGQSVSFRTSDALGTAGLRSLLVKLENVSDHSGNVREFPIMLKELAGKGGARTFKQGTVWRARYQLDDRNGAEIPGRLDLGLRLGPLSEDAQWTVSALLNGHLLMAQTLEKGTRDYRVSLDLPVGVQGASNAIEISAASTENLPGVCNDGPDLIAEMTDASVLLGSGEVLSGPLNILRATLEARAVIGIAAPQDMTPADAAAFSRMIAAAVPETVALRAAEGPAEITLLQRGEIAALRSMAAADKDAWAVFHDEDHGALQAVRATPEVVQSLARRAPLALLIRLSPVRLAEAAQ